MCGLVGIAGAMTGKDDAIIKKLLTYDYFRGPDSTGLAAIRNSGEVVIAKIANDPFTFFHSHQFKQATSGLSRVYMGHNRAATIGGVNNFNAHPFQFGNIVGAHNGTLDAMSWARLEAALGEKFSVDSMALIAAIDKLGIEEAISLCTEGADSYRGAWALTWFDLNDGSINFLRNKHRPLWYANSKDFRRLFWASEWWMMDAAGASEEFEFNVEGKGYRFFPVPDNQHLKFDIGLYVTATEKQEPKMVEVKGREPVKVVTTTVVDPFGREGNSKTHGGGHGTGTRTHTPSSKNSTTTSLGTTPRSVNYLNWVGTKSHPYAGYLNREKFKELSQYGCTWCQNSVEFGELGITVIEEQSMVLCSLCSGHMNVDDKTPTRIYVPNQIFPTLVA